MRKIVIVISAALAAGFVAAPAAGAAPLDVRLQAVDGKARIKVGKKLKVNVTCTKKCAGRLTLTLITPGGKTPVSGKLRLNAGVTFHSRFLLTSFGLSYLKKNLSRSRLKASVSMVDLETGQRKVKSRSFRFYRY